MTLKEHQNAVVSLLVIGDTLLSLDSKGRLIVWQLPDCTVSSSLEVGVKKSILMHPPTYLFKVLIAGDKELELWNVNTGKQIYEFAKIKESFDSSIQVIEESAVVDIVAIGLASGRVIVTNIKTDKVLYIYEAGTKITSLSFSSGESGMEYGLLAASTVSGDIVFWDLNAKKVHCTIKGHNGKSIDKAFFAPGEPILLSSSGEGNSLKMWVFEKGQMKPRLLRSREGADKPANYVRFYGDSGKDILAACGDTTVLQSVSLISDHQNCIFSHGPFSKDKGDKNLPVIGQVKSFAFNKYREYDWANIITCHIGNSECHLWSHERKAIQANSKLETHSAPHTATCVEVSNCGNFAVIGYSNGQLCKLNMQSGLHRGCFTTAHTGPIAGIGIDSTNKSMTTASLDGKVVFWDFYSCGHLSTLDTGSAIEHFVYHSANGLAALVNCKGELSVVDTKTRKIVREFGVAHDSRVTDICFSHDGKWIVSAAADRSLKVWDIMLGILINWLLLPKAVTSMDFSPAGDCLATGVVDEKGIYIWTNVCAYTHLTLNKSPTAPTPVSLPHFSEVLKTKSRRAFYQPQSKLQLEPVVAEKDTEAWKSLLSNPASSDLPQVEFSQQPFTKWQTIYNLESIKEKNKPVEPLAELPPAPFFLYDIKGETDVTGLDYKNLLLDPKAGASSEKRLLLAGGKAGKESENKIIVLLGKLTKMEPASQESKESIYGQITEHLKNISGSRSEAEFTELNSLTGEHKEKVAQCLDYFMYAINSKKDYELIQAHLYVFLKVLHDVNIY